MLAAYFVSDLHLTSEDEPRARLFLQFLSKIKEGGGTHLFLVGDIFDLWLADHDYFQKRYSQIVSLLMELKECGLEIHYFEGNHDFHLSKFWQDKLGFTVHKGPECFQLGPYRVRVEHGDEINQEDKAYLWMRWFFRTWPVRSLICFSFLGRFWGWLGNKLSLQSRKHGATKQFVGHQEVILGQLRSYVESLSAKVDFFISGHIHIKFDEMMGSMRVINLGTWLEGPAYFFLDQSSAQFVELVLSDSTSTSD